MSRPYPQPAGYFEVPDTRSVAEKIARIDDALRYACRVRAKAITDGDTARWQINEQSMDQLLHTRAGLMMDLELLTEVS